MSTTATLTHPILVIIGLGNPGPKHIFQRHNIGFRVLDCIAQEFHGIWKEKGNAQWCSVTIHNRDILLIKPQTYMNSSGAVIPALIKKGIKPENILVIHDELEKPFGSLAIKFGGSHRGHNGLRSIIQACGSEFARLRFGIGRPTDKNDVPDYVLQPFSEPEEKVNYAVVSAVNMLITLIA